MKRDGLIHSIINYGLEDKQGDKIMSEKIKYVDRMNEENKSE